jgi:dihydrofolate reductase
MNAIAAVNLKGYIGKGGDLMYSIKEDLAFFARTTKGKTMVMGRRTLLSLPGGKGLKGRTNVVLSRTMTAEEAKERDVLVARDVDDLMELLRSLGIPEEEVFVIGGGEIYALLLPYCNTLYITRVLSDEIGEVRFPEIPADFVLTEGEVLHSGDLAYRFDTYVRS